MTRRWAVEAPMPDSQVPLHDGEGTLTGLTAVSVAPVAVAAAAAAMARIDLAEAPEAPGPRLPEGALRPLCLSRGLMVSSSYYH